MSILRPVFKPLLMISRPQYGTVTKRFFLRESSTPANIWKPPPGSSLHSTASCPWCLRSLPIPWESYAFPVIDMTQATRLLFDVSGISYGWSTWTNIHTRATSSFLRSLLQSSHILSNSHDCSHSDISLPNFQIFKCVQTPSHTRFFSEELDYFNSDSSFSSHLFLRKTCYYTMRTSHHGHLVSKARLV